MSDFDRRKVAVLELDIDTCANVYGNAPCTAAGAAGSECYNTFRTSCQDKPNFALAVKTWRFCTPGAPVPAAETIRPYIISVKPTATEIDLEKGLAPRGQVVIALADPSDSDFEGDPYHATRATPAQGTFWARWLARNPNHAGRFARLKMARFTDGWNPAQFVTELYVIDRIRALPGGGVEITLKDPSKLADRNVTPAPSLGKLASAILAAGASVPLGTGEGAEYAAAGWVRIGDEAIEYDSITGDTLNVAAGGRGAFGTVAADAGAGASVQQCKVWQNARVWQVLEDLLLDAGMPPGNIDSAGFLAEDDTWLGTSFAVTTCIGKPEKTSALLGELVGLAGGAMWWSPSGQKQKFLVVAPRSPDEAPVIELTEAAHIVEKSVTMDVLEDQRITVAGIYFDPVSATADLSDEISYLTGELRIDADAESANEYGDRRVQIRHARWFGADNAAAVYALVSRRLGHYRDSPIRLTARLDGKDENVKTGDLVDIAVRQLVGVDGAPEPKRCIVTRRTDIKGGVELRLRVTNLGRRWGFWAPVGALDYPDKPEYAHFAADANGFTVDGSQPYAWF